MPKSRYLKRAVVDQLVLLGEAPEPETSAIPALADHENSAVNRVSCPSFCAVEVLKLRALNLKQNNPASVRASLYLEYEVREEALSARPLVEAPVACYRR